MKYDNDDGNGGDDDDKTTFYLFAEQIIATAMNIYWFESSSRRSPKNKQNETGNALYTHIDWVFRMYACVCMNGGAHAHSANIEWIAWERGYERPKKYRAHTKKKL